MAITVYLDTHHISRMASGKSQILRFVSDPAYSFVFSTSHVVECLPKEPRENPGSIAQLNIILNSQARWLVAWAKVASMEESNPAVELNNLFCSKDQMLFSDFKIDRAEWTRRAREGLKEVLKSKIQDQNLRRSFQAKLLKHGKLTSEAFRIIKQQFQETFERVSADLPHALPLLSQGGLYEFLAGTVSEEEFRKVFMESLADPIAFAMMCSDPDLASILDISRFFWSQTDELSEILSRLVVNVRNDYAQAGAPSYARGKVQIEQHLKREEFRSALVRKIAGVEVAAKDLVAMTGTRFFVDIFSQYVLEKLDRFANPASRDFMAAPSFKRSDVADFSHLFYYPYVDIFGCDGEMRNRIKKAGWPTEKVVATDNELESKLIEITPH